ncbi:UNVERIFIED_CONTAM: hypothetical protein RMT77_015673 [Armadillidium vulgare]
MILFFQLLWIFLKYFLLANSDSYWTKIYIESDKIILNDFMSIIDQENYRVNTVGFIQLQCEKRTWCLIGCLEPNGSYLMTNVMVSPFYQNSSESLKCYTRLRSDLTLRAKTSSSAVHQHFVKRVSDNVLTRANIRDHDHCFHSTTTKLWLLLELESVFDIETVVLVPQDPEIGKFRDVRYIFRNLIAKVGNVKQNGDFSSYEFFGNYTGPITEYEAVVIKAQNPIRGKFVSIEKENLGGDELIICFMQVCKPNKCLDWQSIKLMN